MCGQEWRFLPISLFLCFWGDEDRVAGPQLNSNAASVWENVDGGDVFQAAELVWRQEKTPASPAFAPGAQPWPPLHPIHSSPGVLSSLSASPDSAEHLSKTGEHSIFQTIQLIVHLEQLLIIPYIERQPKWPLCASYKNPLIFVI